LISLCRISLHWDQLCKQTSSLSLKTFTTLLSDILSLLVVKTLWSLSPSSFPQSPVPLPLLSLIAMALMFFLSRNQSISSASSLISFILYATSCLLLLLILLPQSWAAPYLLSLSQGILLLSVVGIFLSSFSLSFPLLYAHFSILSTLLSPSVESAAVLVFALTLLFLLSAFSTSLLVHPHRYQPDSKQSSCDSSLPLSVLVLWILQCLSLGRLFYFLSGHRYDFSTLQVFSLSLHPPAPLPFSLPSSPLPQVIRGIHRH
jgi:hypothetical protein